MNQEICSQKVSELQSEFSKRIAHHELPEKHDVPSLLCKIVECDDELVEFALGKVGQKLRSFAQNVDFQHPDIVSIFDGVIANDHLFSQECLELLVLGQFAREKNLQKIIPLLGKMITQESLSRNIIKKIDVPSNNRMHVRFIKDNKEREEIRMTKKMQIIDLQSVYKKGEDAWSVQPDSFKKFLRFDTAYEDDIAIAEKKSQRYKELGCLSLSDEIQKSIENFRDNMDQSYYGFNRITMTNAAFILAKSLGYNYSSQQEKNYSYGNYNNESKINVDRGFFKKYNFDVNHQISILPSVCQSSDFIAVAKLNSYSYEPRVYPLHEFSDILSSNIEKTIELLENFPDAGNKPIFDHFGIIVPGVSYPAPKQILYRFLDESKSVQSYVVREDALKALDKILIKGQYLYAILVGEKDGKCYFISYFV
jgi:hypothetical protein